MKISESLYNKIKAAAEEHCYDFEKLGVRVQEEAFSLGKMTHNSHVWVDGEETDEELDGICVTSIEELSSVIASGRFYFGSHIALLGAYEYEYGEDMGELIFKEAEVIKIFA